MLLKFAVFVVPEIPDISGVIKVCCVCRSRIADDYEQHSVTALKDADQHLSNPINAFLLVKRFTSDWDSVEGLIRNNTADGKY